MNIQKTSQLPPARVNKAIAKAQFKVKETTLRGGRGAVKIDTNGNGKIDYYDRYLVGQVSGGWRPLRSIDELSTQLGQPLGELKTWTGPRNPYSYRIGRIYESEVSDVFPHEGAKPEPSQPCRATVSKKDGTVEFMWDSDTPYEAPTPPKNRRDGAEAGAYFGGLAMGGLTAAIAGSVVGVALSFGPGQNSPLLAVPSGILAAIGGFAVGGAAGYAVGGLAGYALGAPEGSFLYGLAQTKEAT